MLFRRTTLDIFTNRSQHLFNFIPGEWSCPHRRLCKYRRSNSLTDSPAWQLSLTKKKTTFFFKSVEEVLPPWMLLSLSWEGDFESITASAHCCLGPVQVLEGSVLLDLFSSVSLKALFGLRGRSKRFLTDRQSLWEERSQPCCTSIWGSSKGCLADPKPFQV